MLTVPALKALLQANGLQLRKALGQHYLTDRACLSRIIRACDVQAGETVIELGAGLGALTDDLAERAAQVVAVELDPHISELLRGRMVSRPNVQVVRGDLLALDWGQWRDVVVIGAIPYQVTTPLLAALSEVRQRVRRVVLVIQAEVADRLMAKPGTKAYGRLTVLGQYGWVIERMLEVPRGAFFPQPRVDSTCIRLLPRPAPAVSVLNETAFFALVKAAFGQRRKTLINSLLGDQRSWGSRQELERALGQIGLGLAVRGETLSLEQFAALASRLPAPA